MRPLSPHRIAALLLSLVAVLLTACGGSEPADQADRPAPSVAGVSETEELLAGVPQDGLVIGDPKAPVTMVEIIDLQCPFCRSHQLDVQPRVIKEFVRTGRIQLHLVPVAFLGPDSQRMQTVLLRLARTGRAWEFANLVFWNQGKEGSGYATDAFLRDIVGAIPGTKPADAATLASTTPDEQITQSAQLAGAVAQESVRRAGGGGTPFFTVGRTGTALGQLTPVLAGAPPDTFERLQKAIEAVEAGDAVEPFRRGPAAATASAPPAQHQTEA